jgi:two-component system chemotaxis response regulator CheB
MCYPRFYRIAATRYALHLAAMRSQGLAVPHVVAIGASAGGISALTTLLAALPANLPAPLLIVQHLAPDFVSHLPDLLASKTGYDVISAVDGTVLENGRAYVAPADRHLTVDETGHIRLLATVRVRFARPSVDVLFCSAAQVFGERVIAIVLTGTGSDGTEGAHVVRDHGGIVIAQSEASSEYYGMPGSVLKHGYADYALPLAVISQRIIEWTAVPHG